MKEKSLMTDWEDVFHVHNELIEWFHFLTCRQDAYHLLPPTNLPYPELQMACVDLFNSAEQVIAWRVVGMIL